MMDTLIRPTITLWQREIIRFYRQRSRIVGALATPILFWLLLGSGFAGTFHSGSEAGGVGYSEYFYPGTMIMVVLFTAILFGVAFLVLCLSSFNPTMKVGVLSTFLVFYAVVCDLVILPVLLIGADRIGATFAPEEKTMPSEISGRFRDASSTLTSDPAPASIEPEEETEIDESRVRE